MLRRLLAGTLIGLAAAAIGGLAGRLPFFETVERKTYDLRLQATAPVDDARQDIVLVRIDEESVRKLEPLVGTFPWPRLLHARLLDYLARGPAKLVVYDVLFEERDRVEFQVGDERWTGAESDQAFAEAIAANGRVILAADATAEQVDEEGPAAGQAAAQPDEADAAPGGTPPSAGAGTKPALAWPTYRLDDSIEARPEIAPPIDELARASLAIGHSFSVLDPDGPMRRFVPFIRVGPRFVPALGVAAAMAAARIEPDRVSLAADRLHLGPYRIPLIDVAIPGLAGELQRGRRALIAYRGPATWQGRPTYAEYSFYRLFYSEEAMAEGVEPLVDPAVFRDKIVIVGTTAAGLHDVFPVPFAGQGKMPGMQVHANIIDAVLSSRSIEPAPAWMGVAAVLACALAVGLTAARFGVWPIAGVTLLGAGALAWGSTIAFGSGVWLRVTEPALALTAAAFGGVAYQYFVEGREKRQVKRVFSRFVAPDVFHHLLADPERISLGGDRRQMTVLFSDIRGFTTATERGRPEEVVRQLNEYFTRMVQVLFRHRGTLDKFVGDMVMALFGAPLDDEDHADHAVQAALEMSAELEALNREWAGQGRPAFDIGIGVNTGEMVAGNIGSDRIMSYTVIGDAVNLGSRLESLNKQYGTRIIISEHTRARLKGRYDIRPLGEVTVKGKTQAVAIFEVRAAVPRAAAALGQ